MSLTPQMAESMISCEPQELLGQIYMALKFQRNVHVSLTAIQLLIRYFDRFEHEWVDLQIPNPSPNFGLLVIEEIEKASQKKTPCSFSKHLDFVRHIFLRDHASFRKYLENSDCVTRLSRLLSKLPVVKWSHCDKQHMQQFVHSSMNCFLQFMKTAYGMDQLLHTGYPQLLHVLFLVTRNECKDELTLLLLNHLFQYHLYLSDENGFLKTRLMVKTIRFIATRLKKTNESLVASFERKVTKFLLLLNENFSASSCYLSASVASEIRFFIDIDYDLYLQDRSMRYHLCHYIQRIRESPANFTTCSFSYLLLVATKKAFETLCGSNGTLNEDLFTMLTSVVLEAQSREEMLREFDLFYLHVLRNVPSEIFDGFGYEKLREMAYYAFLVIVERTIERPWIVLNIACTIFKEELKTSPFIVSYVENIDSDFHGEMCLTLLVALAKREDSFMLIEMMKYKCVSILEGALVCELLSLSGIDACMWMIDHLSQ